MKQLQLIESSQSSVAHKTSNVEVTFDRSKETIASYHLPNMFLTMT